MANLRDLRWFDTPKMIYKHCNISGWDWRHGLVWCCLALPSRGRPEAYWEGQRRESRETQISRQPVPDLKNQISMIFLFFVSVLVSVVFISSPLEHQPKTARIASLGAVWLHCSICPGVQISTRPALESDWKRFFRHRTHRSIHRNFKIYIPKSSNWTDPKVRNFNAAPCFAPALQHFVEEIGLVVFGLWPWKVLLDAKASLSVSSTDMCKRPMSALTEAGARHRHFCANSRLKPTETWFRV